MYIYIHEYILHIYEYIKLPAGFRFLARPTVLESTNENNPELDCCAYQGLLGAYHLRGAATGVTGVGTSKGRYSLTCFVESCATESTFLLCLLKKPV